MHPKWIVCTLGERHGRVHPEGIAAVLGIGDGKVTCRSPHRLMRMVESKGGFP
jgi:hypothetical protein